METPEQQNKDNKPEETLTAEQFDEKLNKAKEQINKESEEKIKKASTDTQNSNKKTILISAAGITGGILGGSVLRATLEDKQPETVINLHIGGTETKKETTKDKHETPITHYVYGEEDISDLKKKLLEQEEVINDLSSTKTLLVDEIAKVKVDLKTVKKENYRQAEEIQSNRVNLETQIAATDVILNDQIGRLQEQNDGFQKDLSKKLEDSESKIVAQIKDTKDTLETSLKDVKNNVERANAEVKKVSQSVDTLTKQVNKNTSSIDDIKKSIKEESDKVNKKLSEFETSSKITESLDELTKKQGELSTKITEQSRDIQSLRTASASQAAKLGEIEKDVADIKNNLNDQLTQLGSKFNDLDKTVMESKNKLDELTTKLGIDEKNYADLKDKLAALTAASKTFEDFMKDSKENDEHIFEDLDLLGADVEDLITTTMGLCDDLEDFEDYITNELARVESEVNDLEDAQSVSNLVIASLRKEMEENFTAQWLNFNNLWNSFLQKHVSKGLTESYPLNPPLYTSTHIRTDTWPTVTPAQPTQQRSPR